MCVYFIFKIIIIIIIILLLKDNEWINLYHVESLFVQYHLNLNLK
jgi:hypothetical protein